MGALVRSWKGTINRLLSLLLVLLIAGCGSAGTFPEPQGTVTPAPSRVLADTDWALTLLKGRPPAADTTVSLRFEASTFSGSAGCNSYGGEYIADGDRLQVPEIHRTQDTCDMPDIMQQEAAFFQALAEIAIYRATEERLEFEDAQGRTILAFARVHPPSTGSVLPGTRWLLTSLQGQPLLPGTRINLEFGEQWFSGFAGCNYYGGGPDSGAYASTDEGVLKILGVAVTLIGCAEEIMTQEKAYIDAFASTVTYQLVNDRLELRDATGEMILIYARQPECAEEPAHLAGTAWQLISVDGQAPVQGPAATLAFVDDKWFVEHTSCEAYISTYQATGHDLRSGFSAWLGRVCRDEEGQGVAMLESPRDTCLVQGRLQVSTAAGKVFVYEALPEAAQPALEGLTWSLLSIVGERQIEGEAVAVPDPNPLLEATAITLSLAGGMAVGSAGCNTYQAPYSGGTALTFGPVTVTEKACATPEGVMEQEQRYLEALQAVMGYRIVGGQLWLRTADGRALVLAVPVPGARPSAIPESAIDTAAPPTPTPSVTATPAVEDLTPPLIVDSRSSRLYMTGRVDDAPQIVALAAADGRLLATYGMTGTFAVDPAHGWLYVDQNDTGLLVLDAQTGEQKTLISLPSSRQWRTTYPAPQADPTTGQVLAFRDHSVYVIDPNQGAVVTTIPCDIPKADDCRSLTEPVPIEWAVYDDARRLLYLSFVTYVCTPWIGQTLVSFDLNASAQVAQQGVVLAKATASNGSLYGSSWYRMGVGYRWAWRDGRPWFESEGWNNNANLFVDAARGRLYESSSTHGFRALDLETMSLLFILPSPVDGDLVGYDPGTDQLYYLLAGQLATWPAEAILPPSPQTPQVADPPAKPVRHLVVSPAGSQAHTLVGLWDYGPTSGNCYVWGAQGGLFYLSADGGKTWAQPQGGLGGGCQRISALAVSPDYATDRTLLAALVGSGIFRSTDGGQLWQPSSKGLRSMSIDEILLSPGFESDQMAFCWSRLQGRRTLYRSTDGGATWERLGGDLSLVAMSPEFDQDGVLMGISGGQAVVSRDRGETWQSVGDIPDGDSFAWLSLAPLFDQWQVVFAFGAASHNLYRSVDGGRSWDIVLPLEGRAFGLFPPQLEYGPETERGRSLFLLATYTDPNADPPIDQGTLYRSEDGGVSWEVLELPADLVPAALAISPTYAEDGLVWLGTADGRVIPLEATRLHGGP